MGVWNVDGAVGEGAELEAAAGEVGVAFVGENSWPDSVGAVVNEGEEKSVGG